MYAHWQPAHPWMLSPNVNRTIWLNHANIAEPEPERGVVQYGEVDASPHPKRAIQDHNINIGDDDGPDGDDSLTGLTPRAPDKVSASALVEDRIGRTPTMTVL